MSHSPFPCGWQPIETAPRDGREILLWLGAPWSKFEKARWYEPWANWICGAIPDDPAREEYHGIGSALPTHWMPRPASPIDPETAADNAALIAAIPEMVAALEAALCELSHCATQLAVRGFPNHKDSSVSRAQAAARVLLQKVKQP